MKTLFPGAVLILGMTLLTVPASAGIVTYTYTGNPFTNCQVGDCTQLTHVSATLEVSAPLAPSTSYICVAPLITDPGGTHNSAIFLCPTWAPRA